MPNRDTDRNAPPKDKPMTTQAVEPAPARQKKTKKPADADDYALTFHVAPLRAFFDAMTSLVDESAIVVNPEAGTMQARFVDPAHIAMGVLTVNATRPGRAGGSVRVAMDASKLQQRLKLFDQKGVVEARLERDDRGELRHVALEQGRTVRKVALADASGMSDPKVPTYENTANARAPVDDLIKVLKAANEVADHVRLTIGDGALVVLAEGDVDVDRSVFDEDAQGDATAMYSLDYLVNMFAGLKKIGDEVTLRFTKDNPLVAQMKTDHVDATFILAPRVES